MEAGTENYGPGQQTAALTSLSLQRFKDVLPLLEPKKTAHSVPCAVTANFTPLRIQLPPPLCYVLTLKAPFTTAFILQGERIEMLHRH